MQSIHSSLAPGLDEYETLEGFQVHDVETSSILEEPQEAPEGANGLEGGDGQKRPWLTVYKEFFLSSFTANVSDVTCTVIIVIIVNDTACRKTCRLLAIRLYVCPIEIDPNTHISLSLS
jgi:hypothetical protein